MTNPGASRRPGRPGVCIVGCGIAGASLAFHAARLGVGVTVIDRGAGPACGVTGKAFGWLNTINCAPGADPELFAMRARALEEHRMLEQSLADQRLYRWTGALVWRVDESGTEDLFDAHKAFSGAQPLQLVDAGRAGALEPGLRIVPRRAVWCPRDGMVDCIALTTVLMRAAVDLGAVFYPGRRADRLLVRSDGIVGVATLSGDIEADVTILAAGTATPDLAATAGVSIAVAESPAILMTFAVEDAVIDRVISGPTLEVRPASKHRLIVAEDHPGPGMSVSAHDMQARTAAEIVRTLAVATAKPLSWDVGYRPMPVNDRPVLGFAAGCTGLYLASADPGVIFAPMLGKNAARDLVAT